MPDTKISAFPAAGPLLGAELVPIVQGGADVQTTVSAIAAGGGGGGPIWVTPLAGFLEWQNNAADSDIQLTDAGAWNAQWKANSSWSFLAPGGKHAIFSFDTVAGLSIATNGFNFVIGMTLAGQITMNWLANSLTISAFTAVSIQYSPGNPLNWAGSPTTIEAALDRIAAAVVARTVGGAIP
jgi:hypothetical protein